MSDDAEYVVLAASEDGLSRSELRDYGDRYEAVYLRPAVGGGWFVENHITVVKIPPQYANETTPGWVWANNRLEAYRKLGPQKTPWGTMIQAGPAEG